MIERLFASIVDISSLPQTSTDNATGTVLNIIFGLAASIALLMIVIGGFRYVIARGDPSNMAQARSTILYAIVGLVVTMAAYSVVIFVVKGAA